MSKAGRVAEFVELPTVAEKPANRVLLTRVAFGAAIVGQVLGAGAFLYAARQNNEPLLVAAWFTAAPCIGFNLFVVFSLYAFPFNYSWLGRLRLPDPPPGWQPVESVSSAIQIENGIRGSISVWRLGPGGVQLNLWPLGVVFIPVSQIVSVRKRGWWWYLIDHTSQQVRGPIWVNQGVADAIGRTLPEVPMLRE